MSERKYSVSEIDRMRDAISAKFYRWRGPGPFLGGPPDYSHEIELQLRTHMLNGTEPEELHMLNGTEPEELHMLNGTEPEELEEPSDDLGPMKRRP